MVCGEFKEGTSREMTFDDIDEKIFVKLLWLSCGNDTQVVKTAFELFELGVLAERLQMTTIVTVAEEMLLKELKTDTCAEMLRVSEAGGLQLLRQKCCEMLRKQFQQVSRTEGFVVLSEETLSDVLEEDELDCLREEETFQAVMTWIMMREGEEGWRGEGLLRKIRYGLMDDKSLAGIAASALPSQGLLRQLVGEAMTKKSIECSNKVWDGVERLCDKWMVTRKTPLPVVNLPAGTVIGAGVLKEPYWVTIDWGGRVIVSDWGLHQVLVFDADCSVARRFGSKGKDAGQFKQPEGVAVDWQGRIVVADSGNHRIQVLNADGSVAQCFGCEGTEVGQFKCPTGVAVDRDGRIVVADRDNHRIQVFNEDGSVARLVGSYGVAIGQLCEPQGVAVDVAGRIVVVDSYNHRVQVFDSDGTVGLCVGSRGNGPGQLDEPMGVAVDAEGRFVVADDEKNWIQVFNSDGSVSRIINAEGGCIGQLECPWGVAVDGAGRILVADPENKRVQVL